MLITHLCLALALSLHPVTYVIEHTSFIVTCHYRLLFLRRCQIMLLDGRSSGFEHITQFGCCAAVVWLGITCNLSIHRVHSSAALYVS